MNEFKPKRRFYQYSLRTLLIVVALCAIPCSWLVVKNEQQKRERKTAAAVEKLGGHVTWTEPSGPQWLRNVLGDDFFRRVVSVHLFGQEVTDAVLENLERLTQIEGLYLYKTQVTDVGLQHLKGLTQLGVLSLSGTQVTDAGLDKLKELKQLGVLVLNRTQVTDAGIKKLQQALPLCEIECDKVENPSRKGRGRDGSWDYP